MKRTRTETEIGAGAPRKVKKKSDYAKTIKLLYGIAIGLAVATLAVVGIKTYQDLSAEKSAQKLLTAYKEMETTPAPTATPDATAVPVTVQAATPAPTSTPEPGEGTSAETPDFDEAAASHRLDDGSDENVDETASYVQPEAPSVSENEEIIQKVLKAVGDDGVIGTIEITKTEQEYPIIGKWSYDLLKVSVCRYQGPGVNQPGNLVVIGHNYKSGAHFGRLDELEIGDELYLTGTDGKRVRYEVYEIETVLPDKFEALNPYRGEAGLTLMTCQNNGNYRRIVRCVQKEAPASVNASAHS